MKAFLRNIYLRFIGSLSRPKPGVHIINSHFVTPYEVNLVRDSRIFENYLVYLQKFARFITLREATERVMIGDIPKDELLISFTFDDGFTECYSIIAPLLEKYGTRGAFFINAAYIESDMTYQREFYERIFTYTKKPMNWEQVTKLHQMGHLIGSHNLDHTNFLELSDEDIEFQLSENKKILEAMLDYQCDYFAWTYGQMKHFPDNALKITQKYHPYIFSGTNYKNYFSFDGQVLNRRHIEAYWPKSHMKYFLSTNKKL